MIFIVNIKKKNTIFITDEERHIINGFKSEGIGNVGTKYSIFFYFSKP
jgi:hypothetical protein